MLATLTPDMAFLYLVLLPSLLLLVMAYYVFTYLRRDSHPVRRLFWNRFGEILSGRPYLIGRDADDSWSLRFRLYGFLFKVEYEVAKGLDKVATDLNVTLKEVRIYFPAVNADDVELFYSQIAFLTSPYGGNLSLAGGWISWTRPVRQPGDVLEPLLHVFALHCPGSAYLEVPEIGLNDEVSNQSDQAHNS